jgi:hypothetical protein
MKFPKTLIFLAALNLGAIAGPVVAQNYPPGPVHFPTSQAAPSAPASPKAAPAPMPQSVAAAQDIRDIRGPISIPYPLLWLACLACGLALAVGLYAAWRVFRRQSAGKVQQPFEVALDRLEAARALMIENTVREYAFVVSEIIRVYIEQRFGERAAHRTTEEFLSDLLQQTGTPLAMHHRRLNDFLTYCDLTKFARWQLSASDMESMHESARHFILETRPQPEPAKSNNSLPTSTKAPVAHQPELAEIK